MNNINVNSTRSPLDADFTKFKLHPLFEPIQRLFEFVILGNGFMIRPEFQKAFSKMVPGSQALLDVYNKEINLTVKGSEIHGNIQLYLVYMGRLMTIAIFDFLQFSEYQQSLSQTDIFKFAKHIRNGAAHNNRFHFDKKSKAELSKKPVAWRDKVITASLMGKPVIPDFINSFTLSFLMKDISELIESKQTTKQ